MPVNTFGVNPNLTKGEVQQTANSGRAGTTRLIEVTFDDVLSREQVLRGIELIKQRIMESALFPK